ncbi:MAG: hypothetical protein HY259_12590 [Chloroflexi bacterium]|nr:hypothetical protein [Chloroflexota bacterium]MBI3734272.1 hypothetical protein [Chloroflexota bacterium]
MKSALLSIPDLFFLPGVDDALKRLGFSTREVNARDAIEAQLAGADLLIVQLDRAQDKWLRLIEAARLAAVPVLAFGRHTEAAALRAARQAGANKVVPNSELVAELPRLVEQLIAKA